jgi:ABC-type bacteriocin/lantibiotic exporter with double-glycine peptidase domain
VKSVTKILRLLRPYWAQLGQALLAAILIAVISLPGPYLTKVLIDDVYPHQDFGLLYCLLALGAAVAVVLGITNTATGLFQQRLGIGMSFDFQSRLYRHLQQLDFSFYDQSETGEVMSRFRDLQSSVSGTVALLSGLIINLLQLAVFPAVLLYINWRLALISIAVLPFDSLLIALSGRYQRRYAKRIAEGSAELSAKTVESLSGMRTVQALSVEDRFYQKLRERFATVARLRVRISCIGSAIGFAGVVIKAAGTTAYAWYGWTQVLQGHLSLGTFMAFSAYAGYLYGPLQALIGLWPQLQVTLVHADRFFEIYERHPAIANDLSLPVLTEVRGEVRFHDVSFSYGSEPVLQGVNLTIPAGSMVALVGSSGAGKSTLVKMIPRFYDPDSGKVSIDGADVRTRQLHSVRQQIGFAMQGTQLFQGTVRDNLLFGRAIEDDKMVEATRAACIHDQICALPAGYETTVGENGAGLSEGQKQRLALARVFLFDHPILILDEPTSALDTESQARILEALQRVRQRRTTIMVAHRKALTEIADYVVTLEQGRVAQVVAMTPRRGF